MSDNSLISVGATAASPVVNMNNLVFNVIYSPDDDPTKPLTTALVSATPAYNPLLAVTVPTQPPVPFLIAMGAVPLFLSQTALKYINGDPANNIPSLQSTVTAQLDSALGKGNYSASPITVPAGQARARVVSDGQVLIDYWIQGIAIDLSLTVKGFGLSLHVTVDAEFMVTTFLQWPFVQMFSTSALMNANIAPKPGSGTAHHWGLIKALFDQLSGPSLDVVVQSYEMQLDIVNFVPVPLPQLTQLATAFSNFGLASMPLGLMQCVPATDANSSTLSFNLLHAVDPAPVAFNAQLMAGPQIPILFGPVLATPAQATPGGQITVTGSNFPPSNFVTIGWTDTCTGKLTGSIVTVKPPTPGAPYLITRSNNSQPIFMLPQVQPGQTYQVQVQDSDVLTTTQLSNVVPLQAIGELELLLDYQSKGKPAVAGPPAEMPVPAGPAKANLGVASVGVNGGFTSLLTIPSDAVPGSSATLYARVGQQPIASATFIIVEKLQPVLYLVDPNSSTGAVQDPGVNSGYTVAVRGENFPVTSPSGPSNQVGPTHILITINNSTQAAVVGLPASGGPLLVQADGTFETSFVWPSNMFDGTLFVAGNYNLLANKVYRVNAWSAPTFDGVLATLVVTEGALLQ